jgi:hypothetical protein
MLPRVLPSGRPMSRPVGRRGLLLGAASLPVLATVTSGCTEHKPHVPTPRETLLDSELALEESLLSAYALAIQALGPTDSRYRTLTLISAAHQVHRETLLRAGAVPAPPSSTPPVPPVQVPGDSTQQIAATESAVATLRTDTCLRAPADLAPMLASLAASESAHAALWRVVQ